jgi:cysteine-rich repeat protein
MGLRFALSLFAAALVACGSSGKKGSTDAGDGDAPYACTDPATDCAAAPACQVASCGADHTCANIADSTQDGMSCGTSMACQNGMCLSTMAVCGDGVLELGEDCDFGTANNGAGTGCESNCKFSCANAAACDDGNVCNGAEMCVANMVNGATGQVCQAGTAAMNGTACGTGMICTNSTCTADVCGNGFAVAPEECDDGGLNGTIGDGCSSSCKFACVSSDPTRDCASANPCVGAGTCNDTTHVCAPGANLTNGTPCGSGGNCQAGVCTQPICGDGIRGGTEQCDDGNTTNLDGCDASCKFEQVQRMVAINVLRTTDTFCSMNALGTALNATAKSQIDSSFASGIKDGSISVIFDFLGLDDLAGQTDSSLHVGALTGVQQTGATTYNGASDLDWWYTTDASQIDGTRTAKTQMPGSITGGVLTTTPTEVNYKLNFAGVAVTMDMVNSKIKATSGATGKPTTSSGGTPGHLAGEHLDPTLMSFSTMAAGELCGQTTTQSLANTQVPSVLQSGFGKCDANYTTANSLLDVYINGCHNLLGGQLVTAAQPDTSRDGATYHFNLDSSHHVTSCTRNGSADTLSDCLNNATYTTLVTFTTDRVIAK